MGAYRDRADAGRILAGSLLHLGASSPLVLGVPRGGVVVAAEVARSLGGELGAVMAAKVGAPWSRELAIGAVAADGTSLLDTAMIDRMGLDAVEVAAQVEEATTELRRRLGVFGIGDPDVAGRTVIVVDDGVATGATLRAVLGHVRRLGPGRLVCAVPVGPPATIDLLAFEADEVVCPLQPDRLRSVGEWYDVFTQTDDAEVIALLRT